MRPGYHRATRDDLLRPELLPCEIDLHTHAQPVPPVEVRALAVDPDLAADQLAAQQVVEHHGGDPALVAGRIVGRPVRPVVGCGRVGAPTGADGGFDVGEQQRLRGLHDTDPRSDH